MGGLIVVAVVAVAGAGALWLYLTGARPGAAPAAPVASAEPDERADVAEATAIVLLEGNVWSACAFDGHEEDWARFTAAPVRGFAGVPSGRHRVTTTCPSGRGNARLDFVLYPGDVFARRLDVEAARWDYCEDDDDAKAPAPAAAESLIVHRTVLGIARAMRGDAVVVPETAVRRTCAALADVLARSAAAGDAEADTQADEDRLAEAAALGEALVGVPLTRGQLGALTDRVLAAADVQEAARAWGRARRVARLGLAVLPGDPRLVGLIARLNGAVRNTPPRNI